MTIISTKETTTALDLGEGSLDLFNKEPVSLEKAIAIAEKREAAAFPPVSDTIAWFNDIDWADVRQRCRGGVNNCGLVLAVIGEKMHDFGCYLAEV